MKIKIRYIDPMFYLDRTNRGLERYGKTMTIEDLYDLDRRNELTFGKNARKKLEPLIKILHQK